MQVKLNDVIDAIDDTTTEVTYSYYIPEERIIINDDDSIPLKKLIPLPTHSEIDDYGTMKEFIEDLEEGEAKEWLEECIRGAGAFRRFRSTLQRFAMTDRWYDYLAQAHENIAINWCEYYGIEYLEDEPFKVNKQAETITPSPKNKHNYRYIDVNEDNIYSLVYLYIDFRKTLSSFKNINNDIDEDEALLQLKHHLSKNDLIYAIADNGRYIGFVICRKDDDVIYLEAIYVRKQDRLKGVGRLLLQKAEAIAKEYGNTTLYMSVHPNNDEMLSFLKKNGYDVLNLIELRKSYPDEQNNSTYSIGEHEYRY